MMSHSAISTPHPAPAFRKIRAWRSSANGSCPISCGLIQDSIKGETEYPGEPRPTIPSSVKTLTMVPPQRRHSLPGAHAGFITLGSSGPASCRI